jgi:hypothetical protein
VTDTATDLKADSRALDLSASAPSDANLYRRGLATLLAAWERYAHASEGAAVHRLAGVAAAVFPTEPERSVYNNVVLKCALTASRREEVIASMEAEYANAGVTRYAAWVHQTDRPLRSDLERRGYTLDEVTRAMGIALDDIRAPRPELELGPADWSEHLCIAGVAPGLLDDLDVATFHVLVGRHRGENVVTGIAFDFDADSGIYNVGTLEPARRRGLGPR